jgi:hypothetical protein
MIEWNNHKIQLWKAIIKLFIYINLMVGRVNGETEEERIDENN